MKKPPIEVLFLDFGNVCATIDFHRFIVPFSTHIGAPLDEVIDWLTGGKRDGKSYGKHFAAFESGTIAPARFFHELMDIFPSAATIDYETFATMWSAIFLDENHALNALLHRVPQQKFLLSNTNQIVHSRYITESNIIRAHMRSHGSRILSYDIHAMKPSSLIYEEALKRAGVPAHQCFFVDDIPENIAAWEALGGHGIVYNALHDPIALLEHAFKKFGLIT